MQTTRKVGIEMEGYLDDHPGKLKIKGVSIGQDGSLGNDDWDYHDEPYGVELTTKPITDLSILHEAWKGMEKYGWSVNHKAGTHIHVDISDFTPKEMAKLLRFGKGIERIIFMYVDSYRYDNEYCEPIHKDWRLMFRPKSKYANLDWESMRNKHDVGQRVANPSGGTLRYGYSYCWNGKYQWMNVLGSNYNTVEFRLFHAVEDIEELILQARLAEGIVNFVKNSSMEQMEFVIKELYAQTSVEDLTQKFFGALGLDFTLPTVGQEAYLYMVKKLSKNVENKTSDKLASLMQAQ